MNTLCFIHGRDDDEALYAIYIYIDIWFRAANDTHQRYVTSCLNATGLEAYSIGVDARMQRCPIM